jgi:primosomal protein N' (replication factor Y) (superfamily II helicase)
VESLFGDLRPQPPSGARRRSAERSRSKRSARAAAKDDAPDAGEAASPPKGGHVLVAVERGVDRYPDGLLYALPTAIEGLGEGDRVLVPLGAGNQPTEGVIVRAATAQEIAAIDAKRCKSILERIDRGHRLPGELMALARWIAGYYCCPIGMTLAGILPSAVRKGIGAVTRSFVDLALDAPAADAAESAKPRGLSRKQRDLLATITALPEGERPIESRDLLTRAGIGTPGPLHALVERGLLRIERRTEVEARFGRGGLAFGPAPTVTERQAAVIEAIGATLGRGFSQHLLFGVTGSGKTEVYIRLIERTLALGKRALVLVPEIALTPQTAGRLVSRFPGRSVAILHSGLTASQRNHMWMRVASGEAEIVIGARSAIFAPLPDASLGIVIVDEEHDGSYKADQAPRYHGRDVAIRRAQLAGCPIVLGSATPSLESWSNATERGISTLHRLPERAPGLQVPSVRIVDFNEERKRFRDRRVQVIGPTMRAALEETLRDGGQAVILLNRRGYANYIACADPNCEWMLECDQCDAGMICHRDRGRSADGAIVTHEYTRCHHCESEVRLPRTCPDCGKRVSVFGLGTQRAEEELVRLFPSLVEGETMLRIDADAMQGEADFREALERFASGSVRVLLGTQMIAKGLDFPNVRLVGVISADTALHLPDFRAGERTFQLVSQVAGRCGRGSAAGRAIVQTFQPNALPIVLAAQHAFERFAEHELAERARFGLPPSKRLARLVIRDAGETRCAEIAAGIAASIRAVLDRSRGNGDAAATPIEIRDPTPCPISRIAGRYRQQIEILADSAATLTRFITEIRNAGCLPLGEVLAVDVDPIALL